MIMVKLILDYYQWTAQMYKYRIKRVCDSVQKLCVFVQRRIFVIDCCSEWDRTANDAKKQIFYGLRVNDNVVRPL